MYCCIAKLKDSERNLSEREIAELEKTIKLYFNPSDQLTVVCQWILWLTSVVSYADVMQRLNSIKDFFEKQYGSSFRLKCGYAEVKDDDIFSAIDAANQMLTRTTDDHPISGMRYYKFADL